MNRESFNSGWMFSHARRCLIPFTSRALIVTRGEGELKIEVQ